MTSRLEVQEPSKKKILIQGSENSEKTLAWRNAGKIFGRPRNRWEDNAKTHSKGVLIMDRINLAQDTFQYTALVNSVTNLQVSQGVRENHIFIRTAARERRVNRSSMIFLGYCGNGRILVPTRGGRA
jgi:hypothetical protein